MSGPFFMRKTGERYRRVYNSVKYGYFFTGNPPGYRKRINGETGGKMPEIIMTQAMTDAFFEKLEKEGRSDREIREYRRNIQSLWDTAEGNPKILTGEILARWRKKLTEQGLASGTVTNRTVRINRYLRFIGAEALCFRAGGRWDLSGMKFGSLVALEPTERRSKDRSIYWKCRCDACGKEKEIPANQLKKGVQISCGCRKSQRLQETNGYVDGTCLKLVFSDKVSRNNTSGHKGVYRKREKWAAQIQYKKKIYYLGAYDRMEDAIRAREIAEEEVRENAEELIRKVQEQKSRK